MTALAWAAYEGHTQTVDILLNAGGNPDIHDQVAIAVPHCVYNVSMYTCIVCECVCVCVNVHAQLWCVCMCV